MDDESRERSQNPPTKDNFAREKIFLAEQAADGLTVVPGTSWAFHYPHGIAARTTTLAELLTGKVTSEDVVADLRPDAFTYALADLEGQGLSSVAGRVRDVSNYV